VRIIKDGDITENDMFVCGLDELGLPLFQPMVEYYVDQLLKRPVGTISKAQEGIIKIWIETRAAKIKHAYDQHADLSEENNRPRRHRSLGWGRQQR
jgi:hypothetical protein